MAKYAKYLTDAKAVFKPVMKKAGEIGEIIRSTGRKISGVDDVGEAGAKQLDGGKISTSTQITPTGKVGGKPKGDYSPPNNRGLIKQNETADLFAEKGYDIKMLDEVNGGNGYGVKQNSNPDYLIEGKAFDCYSPDVNTSNKNIINTIYKKTTSQTENIVINLDDFEGNIDELTEAILQKTDGDLKHLNELLFVKDGEIIYIFER